jgi:hypothetical protein
MLSLALPALPPGSCNAIGVVKVPNRAKREEYSGIKQGTWPLADGSLLTIS